MLVPDVSKVGKVDAEGHASFPVRVVTYVRKNHAMKRGEPKCRRIKKGNKGSIQRRQQCIV